MKMATCWCQNRPKWSEEKWEKNRKTKLGEREKNKLLHQRCRFMDVPQAEKTSDPRRMWRRWDVGKNSDVNISEGINSTANMYRVRNVEKDE